MTRDGAQAKVDEGRAEGASDFDRTFRRALVVYAVVEFVALALVVCHKVSR